MSIEKFKPVIWTSKFQDDIERNSVFYEDCNHEYEGDAKKPGDTIYIPGLGDVNTRRYSDGKLHRLGAPEEIDSLGQALPISEVSDFYFYVDDLDKRQAMGGSGLLSKYMDKARKKVQQDEDKYIANLVLDENVKILDKTSAAVSATNVMDYLDEALELLALNDVPLDESIVITVPPQFRTALKKAFITFDTDNSGILTKGRIGEYSNATIKMSNNVAKTGTGDYNIQVKTKNAITFVHPYFYMKAEEPSGTWMDAVKGYAIFAGKVTAPKEIINLKVKF